MGSKASRNTSIEALRLVAVAGIAIFHTFQWTFQAVCTSLPEYAPLAVFPYSGALGFINLLGCWANEVFFMISGYFLIPSAIRALQNGSSALGLTLKSLGRLKKIVLPTLFYCATCLFVSMYVYPLPEISLHEIGWLTLGIEFIWVYAASVLLVPVIALIRQRIGSKRAPLPTWSRLLQLEKCALSSNATATHPALKNPRLYSSDSLPPPSRSSFCYRQTASTTRSGSSPTSPLPSYPLSWPPHPLPPQHSISRATKSLLQTRQSYLSPQERSLSTPCSRLPATSGDPSSTMQSTPWQQASKRERPVQPPPFCSDSL